MRPKNFQDFDKRFPVVESHQPRWNSRQRRARDTLPFVAWDGEGYTDETGEHHYNLFGCSAGDHIISPSLEPKECIELLLNVGSRKNAIHVIFAGGYDAVMILRKWPQHIVERILKGLPTHYDGYRVEYFKSKYLKLGDDDSSGRAKEDRRSIVLYDVFTFFSTSFVKACREYLGSSDDFDRIESTKLLRDSFNQSQLETLIIPYWKQELTYLVKLCTILRERMHHAGIYPSQWHGPGAVASTVLRQKGIQAHMSRKLPPDLNEAARSAYYGGRFEQFQLGYYPGTVYQYDIRSAYPFAISRLPSLAEVTWINKQKRKGRFESFALYQISYSAPEAWDVRYMGWLPPQPFPWRRDDKSIYYPTQVHKSWYWGIEIQAAIDCIPGCTITVHDAWEPQFVVTNEPFRWVEDMYNERARMKAQGNPTQLALKLAMNSLYGKMAQSKGARKLGDEWRIPTYHQIEWSGWVTAATRARLFRGMCEAGDRLIAVETDAIYSTGELPSLGVSTQLGDWERDTYQGILYIQSGVYFKQSEGSWQLKSRGFEPRNHTFEIWFDVMSDMPGRIDRTVTHTTRRFGTIPGRDTFARWYDQSRSANILGWAKRIHVADLCESCARGLSLTEGLHHLVVITPMLKSGFVSSLPHKLPWIDDGIADWVAEEWVITEDGFGELFFEE